MTPAKGYTEMKDSGIQWIGEVPVHWEITRMKSILENVSIRNHPEAEVLSLYRDLGVLPKNSRDDNHNVTSEDTAQYKYVEVGNLVINKMKAWQGSLAVSNYEGIVSPAYYVCKFRSSKINKRYIHFLVRCSAYAQEFERLSTGMRVGQWDLGISDFMRVPVLLPPFPEQSAIAAYLDTQCAKIDEIIAQAKASIEDYKQWKASIIYEAVTKGLDPNVEMKDSGIEWIGKIPKQWGTKQIRYLFELRDERNDLPLEQVNLISLYTDLGVVQHSDLEKITGNKAVTADGYKQVYPNDIVVNIILCWMGAIGMSNYAGVTSPAYDVYKPKDSQVTLSKYYHYLFRTARFNGKCYTVGRGIMAMRWRTYSSEFRAIKVPVPSYKTQVQIVEYLDSVCSKIDDLISEKQSLIDNLESYKKSLIYEVVTGKRRVI